LRKTTEIALVPESPDCFDITYDKDGHRRHYRTYVDADAGLAKNWVNSLNSLRAELT